MPMRILNRAVNCLLLLSVLMIPACAALLSLSPLAAAGLYILAAAAFLLINLFPLWIKKPFCRLAVMRGGYELVMDAAILCLPAALLLIFVLPGRLAMPRFIVQIVLAVALEGLLLLNGAARMLFTSVQLGIKWRVLFFLLWWVPVVNLILFVRMGLLVRNEYRFETDRLRLDGGRASSGLCKTKYPILLVHGVFFRDSNFFNYWGRVPGVLAKNGATLFYGNQQSAASVEDSGTELRDRIEQIIRETGCGKVNIIAHSKGGLDARYAVSRLGMDRYVASLTTINTPHRGCAYADYLLEKAPEKLRASLAGGYNAALRRLGDKNPDFLAAIRSLTAGGCAALNAETPDKEGVWYQSVASRLNQATGGKFPLNMSYLLVRHFDGPNDGLVSVDSAVWGDKHTLITVSGKRGVSHGDVIDLNRENIPGFDVREFYVNLVSDLRQRGF